MGLCNEGLKPLLPSCVAKRIANVRFTFGFVEAAAAFKSNQSLTLEQNSECVKEMKNENCFLLPRFVVKC